MRILQRFECCIVAVDVDDIDVILVDLTHDNPDEFATISKNNFTRGQQPLLQLGYVFLWEIVLFKGSVDSTFTFKPLEVFTQQQIDSASLKAQQLFEALHAPLCDHTT